MDIQKVHHIHFVGIAGVAMTALAIYAKQRGFTVTGSDVNGIFPTRETLAKAGIDVLDGFSSEHIIKTVDLVVFTGAHNGKENIEVVTATQRGISTMPHGEALGFFMDGHEQISVAGSHGKTTTSAMIATIFSVSGKDPSYAIGCGDIRPIGAPGHFGKGTMFVAEADEYITDPHHDPKPRFLWQHPDTLVVTNIDFDHPDAYGSLDDVKVAFQQLASQLQGRQLTIVSADDPESRILDHGSNTITYGFSPRANAHITHIHFSNGCTFFTLSMDGDEIGEFMLHVPGRHNVLNAVAAAVCAISYGISWEDVKKGLSMFGGTKRRFELLGESHDRVVIDDYAHHPKEIQATLRAAREWFPNHTIVVVFQPHTYSRTKALLEDFSTSFSDGDIICITDIFASARETDTLGITAQTLVDRIATHGKDVHYTKDKQETLVYLKQVVKPRSLIITMGAGDIYEWGKDIVSMMKKG